MFVWSEFVLQCVSCAEPRLKPHIHARRWRTMALWHQLLGDSCGCTYRGIKYNTVCTLINAFKRIVHDRLHADMRSYGFVLRQRCEIGKIVTREVVLNRPGEAKLLEICFPDVCFCDTVVLW